MPNLEVVARITCYIRQIQADFGEGVPALIAVSDTEGEFHIAAVLTPSESILLSLDLLRRALGSVKPEHRADERALMLASAVDLLETIQPADIAQLPLQN